MVLLESWFVLSWSNLEIFNGRQLSEFVKFGGNIINKSNTATTPLLLQQEERDDRLQLKLKQAAQVTSTATSSLSIEDDMNRIDRDDPMIQDFQRKNNNNSNNTTQQALLPKIFQDYFIWHYTQLQQLYKNPNLVSTKRYVIMECHYNKGKGDIYGNQCGGISDRLTPLPMALYLAYLNKRIFFISWNRPFGLEEYLEPPPSVVLDWRMPQFIYDAIYESDNTTTTTIEDTPIITNKTTETTEITNAHAKLSSLLLLNENQAVVYMKSNTPENSNEITTNVK